MSFYLKDGELLWPTEASVYDVRGHLPVGTYTVGLHPMKGFYLKSISDFNIGGKIYGNIQQQADRILSTFDSRPASTGVLLNGEKGSGKTMLAKMISQQGAAKGIPTLVINSSFCGDAFNSFIQSIDEPCIIVFDEFEKVFDGESQEKILTLFDGVYPSKKLFVLTCNDKYRVNQHMRNRPGRIFYMLDFTGPDIKFIEEYCLDVLVNKSHIQTICRLTKMFESFNFDMLKALVEEMNRYNESPAQALDMLNAKPQSDGTTRHNIKVLVDGKEVPRNGIHPCSISGNPLMRYDLDIGIDTDPDNIDADYIDANITSADLRVVDHDAGSYTYVINEGEKGQAIIIFTRDQVRASYNWLNSLTA